MFHKSNLELNDEIVQSQQQIKKSTTIASMFSLPYSCSFTPIEFNWFIYNTPLYYQEDISQLQQIQTKTVFSPILIASPTTSEDKTIEETNQESKQVKKENSNEKCQTEDEEYTPGNSQNKKLKKNQQNQNRNIMPNIVNQILSFVQKKNKSLSMTQKIFEKYNAKPEWSAKRFYLYQTMLKNKISHYVNEQTMRIFVKTGNVDLSVYCCEQQQFYNKVSRILIFHFLKTEAQTSTLTSKRMDKNKKAAHIEVQSQLTEKLKQIYQLH